MTGGTALSLCQEASSSHFEELVQVPDLWFEDGNLILQAENSLFRIYRGLLSARSSVFRDMFGFPPPPEGNRVMDGCPLVQVYDTAKDMAYFLKAILDSEFFKPPPSKTELSIVAAVLRLSTKYDVHYLRTRALAHLQSTFPTTFDGWKEREATRTIPSVENTPFAALQLTREFDLPWLVPAIAYCISSHDLPKTLDGAEFDGTAIKLAWPDQRLCIIGRSNIIQRQNAHALSMVKGFRGAGPATPDEDEEAKCTGRLCVGTRVRCAEILARWGTAGFLDFFHEQQDAFRIGFCEVCLERFRAHCEASSRDMWNALPMMFELPNWEELERLRKLSLG